MRNFHLTIDWKNKSTIDLGSHYFRGEEGGLVRNGLVPFRESVLSGFIRDITKPRNSETKHRNSETPKRLLPFPSKFGIQEVDIDPADHYVIFLNKAYLIRTNFREALISRFSRFVKNREIKDSLKLGYAKIKHAKFNTLL